ncbi:reverse transcriptase domain-containing protein [Tanacetum coccineum]|uniref:Reverse transcriptase domain-containing protein n=1 Tax=Tanacetum coccineum TaxID=301880 RepID=A0ABQ5HEA8_9ASTR
MKSQQSTNAFVKETFMDLKTQLETVAKNHQASIQNLETKFDRLADKQSGRPSGSLPSNTQPKPKKGHNSKAYQPPQSRNEHVNVVFTRSAKNMLVEVGKFTFPADFVILEMEEDSKVPFILGRPFIHTADAVIRAKQKQLNLGVGTERMIFNIDSAMKHSYSNDDTCFSIDVIDEILEEDFDALLDEGSKILHSIKGTLLEEEIFAEFDEFIAMTVDENSNSESDIEDPPFKKITINTDYKSKPYFLPVIISSRLSKEKKNKLVFVLKKHKEAFAWKTTDIPEKTTPRCPFGSIAYRRMPFSLCNVPATFQRYMLAIFHDIIEESVEVFMDDFSVFKNSFETCLNNLDKMLQRCKDAHLVLNWEKCHFMVKEGIVLGHKVSSAGLEV